MSDNQFECSLCCEEFDDTEAHLHPQHRVTCCEKCAADNPDDLTSAVSAHIRDGLQVLLESVERIDGFNPRRLALIYKKLAKAWPGDSRDIIEIITEGSVTEDTLL